MNIVTGVMSGLSKRAGCGEAGAAAGRPAGRTDRRTDGMRPIRLELEHRPLRIHFRLPKLQIFACDRSISLSTRPELTLSVFGSSLSNLGFFSARLHFQSYSLRDQLIEVTT